MACEPCGFKSRRPHRAGRRHDHHTGAPPVKRNAGAGKTRIVIVGGGFAGVFAAKYLRRYAAGADVELINDNNYFVFQPLLPEVVGGTISIIDAVSPLRLLLSKTRFRMADVELLDLRKQTVRVLQGLKTRYIRVPYDHLVITCGLKASLASLPGFAEHGLPLKNVADTYALRNHVIQCLEHADVTNDPKLKKKLLTFTVAGGGFSGVETVGEIHEMLRRTVRYYPHVSRDEIRLVIAHGGARLLPELSAASSRYIRELFEKRGIELQLGRRLASATGTSVHFEDGGEIETMTLITTVGMTTAPVISRSPLHLRRGRIVTNRLLQAEGYDNVWALGDAACIPLDDDGEEYAPPTAQFAVREAKQLAKNLAASIAGRTPAPFSYDSRGALASLGHHRGIGEIYNVRLSGISAWLLWRSLYLSMLPGATTRLRVAVGWLLDLFLPRSIVQIEQKTQHACRLLRFKKGDVISQPGQVTRGLYTVVSGALEDYAKDAQTGEELVRVLGAGTHWGERTASDEITTVGTLRAIKDSTVLVLDKRDFKELRRSFNVLNDYFANLPESLYPQEQQRRTPHSDDD